MFSKAWNPGSESIWEGHYSGLEKLSYSESSVKTHVSYWDSFRGNSLLNGGKDTSMEPLIELKLPWNTFATNSGLSPEGEESLNRIEE